MDIQDYRTWNQLIVVDIFLIVTETIIRAVIKIACD